MAQQDPTTVLKINSPRSGSVQETQAFLSDMSSAYDRIQCFFVFLDLFDPEGVKPGRLPDCDDLPFPVHLGPMVRLPIGPMPPDEQIEIKIIRIESPGFWEFEGAARPLQQIREYLNDRHGRGQDGSYRERTRQERLALENKMIQRRMWELDASSLADRFSIMTDSGIAESEIRRLVWFNVSQPLIHLGEHQDSLLIQDAQ